MPSPGRPIGGGLDGPLRDLPQQQVAPAEPALERRRGRRRPPPSHPQNRVAPAQPALEQAAGHHAVRFGASLSLHPPAEQWALVRRIEELGFESIWTGDHVSFYLPLYESLTLLASYASITTRLRLGTAVYLLALRQPAIVAKITSTLDALSTGRLIFGVGVGGENPKEFEASGVPHRERGARVDEGIEVVRTLWRDTAATFKGRFTSFEGVSIDPKPAQPGGPPIWV
ncbi:MAG: hypothetical protein DMD82_06310, partial [Candidatus Rokuibacteriota bacterium]